MLLDDEEKAEIRANIYQTYQNRIAETDFTLTEGVRNRRDQTAKFQSFFYLLTAVGLYVLLRWLGFPSLDAAVVSILAMLSTIAYAISGALASLQLTTHCMRKENAAHYHAINAYEQLRE